MKVSTKVRFVILLIICLIGAALSQVQAAELTKKDELFIAGMMLHTADYLQTMGISKSCRNGGGFYETNPILGKCPSASKVGKYFLATAVAMAVIHYKFDTNVPAYAWIVVETGAVANNVKLGISMRF